MDIASLLGIVLGLAMTVFGILSNKAELLGYIDVPSVIITIGGSITGVLGSFKLSDFINGFKSFALVFKEDAMDPGEIIGNVINLANVVRKEGLLALEEKANQQEDPFFKQSIMLIVDATDPEKVKTMLENDLEKLATRHEDAVGIYEKASAMAPAFGMIGTLVGLVNMLKNMSMDEGGSSTIGKDMGTALITTFYGCILANLIFGPIAMKLKVRSDEEYLCKEIIIAGVLSIQSGETPKFMEEKLISFLEQSEREKAMAEKD